MEFRPLNIADVDVYHKCFVDIINEWYNRGDVVVCGSFSETVRFPRGDVNAVIL